MEFRKTNYRNSNTLYRDNAVIRISKKNRSYFIVSQLIVEQLKMNVATEGIMFKRTNDGKILVFKEPLEYTNFKLGKGDKNTYRFTSRELYGYFERFFTLDPKKEFILVMDKNFKFKKYL